MKLDFYSKDFLDKVEAVYPNLVELAQKDSSIEAWDAYIKLGMMGAAYYWGVSQGFKDCIEIDKQNAEMFKHVQKA